MGKYILLPYQNLWKADNVKITFFPATLVNSRPYFHFSFWVLCCEQKMDYCLGNKRYSEMWSVLASSGSSKFRQGDKDS